MALTGLHTDWQQGSYKADRDYRLKVLEDNELRKGTNLKGLRPHLDKIGSSIVIGYGLDLLGTQRGSGLELSVSL
jgi:hypothetical protein